MGEPLVINSWASVENLILRPPRAQYRAAELLGGVDGEFDVQGLDGAPLRCFRMDVELKNGREQRLVCSHYIPCERWKVERTLPCVIYCHGNAGCRVDANVVAFALLKRGLTCFCFDFGGSGQSDGDIVTLGSRESGDLDTVVSFLRVQGRTSHIAVWGRSMGAVTAALYARTNLSIAGVVLDSPFARLPELIRDIVARDLAADVTVPGLLVSAAILALRTSIRRRTGVDINAIDALAAAPGCYQPALLVHAVEDELIHPCHSEALARAWAGDCRLLLVGEEQGHNSMRPRHIILSAVAFLCNVLGGGLKDADAIFRGVGDGSPPAPAPQAPVDPNSTRAAMLQQLWLRMAEESADIARAAGVEREDASGLEEEEEKSEEEAEDAEDDWERPRAPGTSAAGEEQPRL